MNVECKSVHSNFNIISTFPFAIILKTEKSRVISCKKESISL